MSGKQQEAQASANSVAGDHGRLQRPAIDKDSGQNAKDGNGQHVRDLDTSHLLCGRVEFECENAYHGEERKEVTED